MSTAQVLVFWLGFSASGVGGALMALWLERR